MKLGNEILSYRQAAATNVKMKKAAQPIKLQTQLVLPSNWLFDFEKIQGQQLISIRTVAQKLRRTI